MSITDNPIFNDADKARDWLERQLWREGPICPHCGVVDCAYVLNGTAHRPGVYKCKMCEEQFTVTVGTVMHRSHIPLNKWLVGFYLISGAQEWMNTHQISHMLGLTYKSAWFLRHRISKAVGQTMSDETELAVIVVE